MRLQDSPEERVVGFDVNAPFLSRRNLLFVLDRFQDARNGRPCEAQEEDVLPRSEVVLGDLRRLEDRDRRLS